MRIIASAVTALSLATLALGQASSSQQVQSTSQQPQQSSAAASGNGSSSGSAAVTTAPPSVVVTTSYQQTISLSGPNRAQVTISVPVVISSTIVQAQPSGSAGGSGTQQPAGSGTTSTSTTPTTLPTAASTVGANGQGGQVAPSPGGSNPALGPDDNYISGARQLAIGGVTVLLGFGAAMAVQMM
ncbi:unnamed protein product [Rhizoctonia solani]|uniref:Uncharacterized protein n=1 Tax=Rhizoctonia solani TaxID=456999 RepID=A0A8H3AMA6_9AGAM|nr:unnamed protein product [Rhizoctonia solani]